ncbi:MAG: GxGYxYP family putative glycoside hydrolase, partial [Abditibacteriales bacterium]|nr:GxGYxYP family putative glycoside hydrolase [Abditibacteriales bacterium]
MRDGTDAYSYPILAGMGGFFYLSKEKLPAEDELTPIVNVHDARGVRGSIVAAIKHHCAQFKGAVDVWAGTQWLSDPRDPAEILMARQLVLRSAIYALETAGALTAAQARAAKKRLEAWVARHVLPKRKLLTFAPVRRRRVFPQSPPVSAEEAVVVHSVAADDQPTRVALGCLQGLVNAQRPRLYLIYTDHDDRWLRWYQERGYVKRVERMASADAVIQRFRAVVKGAILVDERFLNVGTMLASVRGGMVCTPALAERWSLPVIADLRGRWRRDVDAYRWAFRTLWPQMNQDVLCSGHPRRSPQQTDYLVAHRIFTFFISGGVDGADEGKDPAEEIRLAEEILAACRPNGAVMGWWSWSDPPEGIGEYMGMTLASRYAKMTIGTEFMTNMSFHSGIPAPQQFRQPQIQRLPPIPLQQDKVY